MATFDQAVLHGSPSMTGTDATKRTPRIVSALYYDEQRQQDDIYDSASTMSNLAMPHLLSLCSSEESITGEYYGDIERDYHVDPRVLGTGHHGSVRKCFDRRTGRQYAVKSIFKNNPSVKPAGLAREIALLREMKHDNIVELVDVYEDAEYVHLVTDLCEGGELFDKIVDQSTADNGVPCLTEDEAARIVHQILTGVSYMQERGVAHRDIKPENILFVNAEEEDSRVKIVDFGLSRKHSSRSGKTPMTSVVGTPYYIAPEVLRRRGYDKRCDLWSIGVIAYVMLCGYPPFNGPDNDSIHKSVLRGLYYFAAEDWNCVSDEAMDFIRKLLQVDPRRRMTVKQAMNHPWIAKRVGVSTAVRPEARKVDSSTEVLCNEMPRKHLVVHEDIPPRRKVRMSPFGLEDIVHSFNHITGCV